MDSQYRDITYAKDCGVAIITLNRPEKLNAFSMPMCESIVRALEDARDDEQVRCVVLTGAGRGFCSGMDVAHQQQRQSWTPSERLRWALHLSILKAPVLLQGMDKPSIAAINGVCTGGGLGLALACDIRFAADVARIGSVFIRRALVPDCGATYFLPRLLGTSRACELAMTGELVDAREAQRLGLFSKVVPLDELMSATMDLATRIAKGPPIAMGMTKRAIYKALDTDLQSQIEYEIYSQNLCQQTEDYQEALSAFYEKREPIFKGE